MVSEGPGGIGTRIINKDYPNAEGLTAGTTKQTKRKNLKTEKSFILERNKKLL